VKNTVTGATRCDKNKYEQNGTVYIVHLCKEITKVSLEKGKVVENELRIEQKKKKRTRNPK
jgi:hypothetical protein